MKRVQADVSRWVSEWATDRRRCWVNVKVVAQHSTTQPTTDCDPLHIASRPCTRVHTYIRTHIHTCIHAYIQAHTWTLVMRRCRGQSPNSRHVTRHDRPTWNKHCHMRNTQATSDWRITHTDRQTDRLTRCNQKHHFVCSMRGKSSPYTQPTWSLVIVYRRYVVWLLNHFMFTLPTTVFLHNMDPIITQ